MNKKEFTDFVESIDSHINFLISILNDNGFEGENIRDFDNRINDIQEFYETKYFIYDEIVQNKLRLSFWAFFAKLLTEKLGGELRIAPKSDYCEGTPQLINFGNKFDKKGKRKWIGIGFDSWFNGIIEKKLLGTLEGTVEHVLQYYTPPLA
ncbi:hypothetical protein [Flavobacterium frigoris]|nr:hypothetical protein [Flavobacterium frigoris]